MLRHAIKVDKDIYEIKPPYKLKLSEWQIPDMTKQDIDNSKYIDNFIYVRFIKIKNSYNFILSLLGFKKYETFIYQKNLKNEWGKYWPWSVFETKGLNLESHLSEMEYPLVKHSPGSDAMVSNEPYR